MVRETWVQSQVMSFQRLLKWYLMLPCLTLSNMRYVSRVKWSNPGKGVAPSPTPRCSKLFKREPFGRLRLKGGNFITYLLINLISFIFSDLTFYSRCFWAQVTTVINTFTLFGLKFPVMSSILAVST